MRPHDTVRRLVELKQRAGARTRDAGQWQSAYVDELFTDAAALAPGARLPAVERLARTLDLLVTETAALRERGNVPAGAPLRTPDDDVLPGIGGDIDVTVTRGEPGGATRTALDRLGTTLDGDWVVIISGDGLHLTARPAHAPAAQARFTPRFTAEPAPTAPAPGPADPDPADRRTAPEGVR